MSGMYRVLKMVEIQDLLWELHSFLPGSAKMYYIIKNFVDNLLHGFEVIVDQWPCWTCIILRPESNEKVPGYFRSYYMCHTKSLKDLRFFLQRPGVVDWTQKAVLSGVPHDVVPIVQDKVKKVCGELTSIEHRFMYAWMKDVPPEPAEVPEGMKLTVLDISHAERIRNHWEQYRTNPGLLEYFRKVIENFESSAIMTSDGRLVAYICMQFNGSMANLFVDPEYHADNLGVILLRDLTRKLIQKHHTAYGFIKTKDSAFISTCQSIGFTWVPQGSMSWLHYCPPIKLLPGGEVSSDSMQQNINDSHGSLKKDLFLTALPLSCNECSGIPAENGKVKCIHVGVD